VKEKRDGNTEFIEGRTERAQRRETQEKRVRVVALGRKNPPFPPEADEGWGTLKFIVGWR